MNAQDNPSTEEYVAEFNQRMSAMAEQQRRAFALLLAERVARSQHELLEASRQPPPMHLRLAGWFRQQATGWMRKHEREEQVMDAQWLPDADGVIIIDAEYRVVEINATLKEGVDPNKEVPAWDN